jgi:hypothetical protein
VEKSTKEGLRKQLIANSRHRSVLHLGDEDEVFALINADQ